MRKLRVAEVIEKKGNPMNIPLLKELRIKLGDVAINIPLLTERKTEVRGLAANSTSTVALFPKLQSVFSGA